MKRRIYLLLIILNMLSVSLFAGEIDLHLNTSDGTSAFSVNNSQDVTKSSITTDGKIYGSTLTFTNLSDGILNINNSSLFDSLTIHSNIGNFDKIYVSSFTFLNNLSLINDLEMTGNNLIYESFSKSTITAHDSNGLSLFDNNDSLGIHINDSGDVGIGKNTQSKKLDVLGSVKSEYGIITNTLTINEVNIDTLTLRGTSFKFEYGSLLDAATIQSSISNFEHINVSTITKLNLDSIYVNSDVDVMNNEINNIGNLYVSTIRPLTGDGVYLFNSNNDGIHIDNSLNVGINKLDPNKKIDVLGNIKSDYGVMSDTAEFSQSISVDTLTDTILTIDTGDITGGLTLQSTIGDFNIVSASTININNNDLLLLDNGKLFVDNNNLALGKETAINDLDMLGNLKSHFGIIANTLTVTDILTVNTLENSGLSINSGALTGALTVESSIGDFGRLNVSTISLTHALTSTYDIDMYEYDITLGGDINANELRAMDHNGLYLVNSNNDGLFIEDGGKVGIDMNNPSYRLELYNGNVKASAGISAGYGSFTGEAKVKKVYFNRELKNAKIQFHGSGDSNYQFYGLGIQGGTQLYHIYSRDDSDYGHKFSAGNGGSQNTLMTIGAHHNGSSADLDDNVIYGWTELGTERIKIAYIKDGGDTGNFELGDFGPYGGDTSRPFIRMTLPAQIPVNKILGIDLYVERDVPETPDDIMPPGFRGYTEGNYCNWIISGSTLYVMFTSNADYTSYIKFGNSQAMVTIYYEE